MAGKSWFPAWGDRNRDVEHFRGFKTQIDSLFEDWFGRSMGGVLAPRVDVAEDDKSVTLTAELPGVNEEDIEVTLAGDQLTIKGEKHSELDEKKESERPHGAPHGALLRCLPAHADRPLPGGSPTRLGAVPEWRSGDYAAETARCGRAKARAQD